MTTLASVTNTGIVLSPWPDEPQPIDVCQRYQISPIAYGRLEAQAVDRFVMMIPKLPSFDLRTIDKIKECDEGQGIIRSATDAILNSIMSRTVRCRFELNRWAVDLLLETALKVAWVRIESGHLILRERLKQGHLRHIFSKRKSNDIESDKPYIADIETAHALGIALNHKQEKLLAAALAHAAATREKRKRAHEEEQEQHRARLEVKRQRLGRPRR